MNVLTRVLFFPILATATGCMFLDPNWTLSFEYDRNCKEKAGTKIHETVRNVDGYLRRGDMVRSQERITVLERGCDADCIEALVVHGYRFVEASAANTEPERDRIKHGFRWPNFTEGPGLYRFTLERRGHPNCRVFEQRARPLLDAAQSPRGPDLVELKRRLIKTCVASERIDTPKAEYVYSKTSRWEKRSGFSMHHDETKIERLGTGQVVAVANRYSLYHSMMDGSTACPVPSGQELTVQNVLIPRASSARQ